MLLSLWLACTGPGGLPDVPSEAEAVHANAADGLPLAAARTAELQQRLDGLADADTPARHRAADGRPAYVNRLAEAHSAYLLQHAHNPVDWFPWGDEAFEQARLQDKPVLLSIGYSTCHWCHVMEHESFEDPEIAAYINEHFVPVKVDREELPDVDAVYMTAVQAVLRGRGGWPMTVFLTPDRKPFHAATYLPARDGDRGRTEGLLTVLARMHDAWTQDRDKVEAASANLSGFVARQLERATPPSDLPGSDVLDGARDRALGSFDPKHGGRQGAPKFPSGWPLPFVMDDVATGHDTLSEPLRITLDAMATRGLYDVVGGGFHRYTVDETWHVPHFEKMLYDNALLAGLYLDAWRIWDDPAYAEVVRGVLKDQRARAPGALYAAAADADSPAPGHTESIEGGFYTFTRDEALQALAGLPDPEAWVTRFGIEEKGPVEGRSPIALNRPAELLDPDVRAALDALGASRSTREAPFVDPKAVVAWNGLMLSTLARTGRFLDPAYRADAEALATTLLDAATDRRLPRIVGTSRTGVLSDQAFVAAGFLDLFETTGDPRWLAATKARAQAIEAHHTTPEGGWMRTPDDGETLLARPRADRDGAEPSGASVHVRTLLRLGAITGDDAYRARADHALKAYADALAKGALDDMLPAVAWRQGRPLEIVVVAPRGQDHDPDMLAAVDARAPWRHVRLLAWEDTPDALQGTVATGKLAHDGRTTVYVCEAGMCQAPVNDEDGLDRVMALFAPVVERAGR